ncbi:MAG TPA: hypothetical protein VMU11_04110 [Verrucomicrobiae bacterium]|nr:hypothetical protein [Verrucomicrobiae bacterium]
MGEVYRKIEFKNVDPELLKKAEQNVETWKASFDTVLGDLQEAEAEEGIELPDGDPRLMIVNLCAMRLDQAKQDLKELGAN